MSDADLEGKVRRGFFRRGVIGQLQENLPTADSIGRLRTKGSLVDRAIVSQGDALDEFVAILKQVRGLLRNKHDAKPYGNISRSEISQGTLFPGLVLLPTFEVDHTLLPYRPGIAFPEKAWNGVYMSLGLPNGCTEYTLDGTLFEGIDDDLHLTGITICRFPASPDALASIALRHNWQRYGGYLDALDAMRDIGKSGEADVRLPFLQAILIEYATIVDAYAYLVEHGFRLTNAAVQGSASRYGEHTKRVFGLSGELGVTKKLSAASNAAAGSGGGFTLVNQNYKYIRGMVEALCTLQQEFGTGLTTPLVYGLGPTGTQIATGELHMRPMLTLAKVGEMAQRGAIDQMDIVAQLSAKGYKPTQWMYRMMQ